MLRMLGRLPCQEWGGSEAYYRGCMGIPSGLTKSTEHPSRGPETIGALKL